MNYLAIDYGQKRIGVARSVGNLAEPVTIIEQGSKAVDQIVELCQKLGIDELVFGLSEGEMAKETRSFARIVGTRTSLPISFFDETLSSREVSQMLIASGKKMQDRRQPIDHYAAAHVLQQFLDAQLKK